MTEPTAVCPVGSWVTLGPDASPIGVPMSSVTLQQAEDWKVTRGRLLWAELHRRALVYQGDEAAESAWLAAFTKRIPCGACRAHWLELIAILPPDLSSPEAYFAWSVLVHNLVNVFKEVPSMPVGIAEARARWTA